MSDEKTFIHRCPHDKENPYAMISRDLIRDESLSMSCRWMLIYLLSQSGEWKISVKQIWNHCKRHRGGGRDSVRGWIGEAVEAGYMKREEYKNHKNLNRVRYYLSETPKFKKSFLRPEIQGPEEQAPADHTYKNKHPSSKEEVKKNGPTSSDFMHMDKYPHITKLPSNSYGALIEEHGKEMVEEYIDKLNDYADISPSRFEKYNNHGTVIRSWIKRDRAQKASQKPENALKLIHQYIQTHEKKEVLKKAVNANLIKLEREQIVIHGQMAGNPVISFLSPGATDKIDNLIQKLSYQMD